MAIGRALAAHGVPVSDARDGAAQKGAGDVKATRELVAG